MRKPFEPLKAVWSEQGSYIHETEANAAIAQDKAEHVTALKLLREAILHMAVLLSNAPDNQTLDALAPDNEQGREYDLGRHHESTIRAARAFLSRPEIAALKQQGEG